MSPGSFLLTLASCLVLTAFQQAGAACPSSHLEPTLDYGRAFGNTVSITTGIDIGPDGWVIDVGVRWRSENEVKFIGGTAYAPIAGTPAGHLGVLGRALRAVATGELAESELEKALREKGIVKPPG